MKPGDGTPGPGRPAGIPNKATSNAREAIAAFVDDNVPLLTELLVEIRREDGPRAAFDCIMDVVEYHIPKLARIETTGDKGVQIFIGCRDSDVAIISSSDLAGELPAIDAEPLSPQSAIANLPEVSESVKKG